MQTGSSTKDDLSALIRTIPDFPKPGILYRDITTLLLDARGFALTVERLAAGITGRPDLIAGTEARGFVFAAALAHQLGTGLLLIRKHGKLPGETIAEEYALEYGTDRLAMHVDACAPGTRVELVDDLIATGGTALAAARLIRRAGADVTGASFVIELPSLGGATLLRDQGIQAKSLIRYEK
jgi:adenine phosphoribosyltransferase